MPLGKGTIQAVQRSAGKLEERSSDEITHELLKEILSELKVLTAVMLEETGRTREEFSDGT